MLMMHYFTLTPLASPRLIDALLTRPGLTLPARAIHGTPPHLLTLTSRDGIHTASRSKPPAQSKEKTKTHTDSMHTDIHTWEKRVITTLLARQQPALPISVCRLGRTHGRTVSPVLRILPRGNAISPVRHIRHRQLVVQKHVSFSPSSKTL